MKALIIDPALHSMGGHHYTAVGRLQGELGALGVDAPCLGSAYADRHVVAELACTPTFTRAVYGRSYAAATEFAESVEETSRQLSQAMRRLGTAPDLIVLPCCDQVLAAAVARHLKRARVGIRPHLLLWLLYGPHHMKGTDDSGAADLIAECRDAIAGLIAGVGGARRLKAYCETSALADFYRDLTGLDVGVMTGPGLVAQARPIPAIARQPPTVSCIGFANRPKGYRLLPGAIRHVLAQRQEARFMIHGVVAGSDAEADRPIFDELASLGERVVVRQDVLSPQAYLAWLLQADLLLLPYDRTVYRSRGSGVFGDAQGIGIPVVATRGCAFAQPAFDDGWGVPIEEPGAEGVGVAVLSALDRLDDLAARAALAANRARDALGDVLRLAIDESGAGRPSGLAGRWRRWRAGPA